MSQKIFSALYKPMSQQNADQKATILGLLTMLRYQFDTIEYFDNQLFKHSLKQAAENFKKQLERSFEAYYKDKPQDEIDIQMNSLNDLCQVIERNIKVSYQLAELPTHEADAFITEYANLLNKYNLGDGQLIK